MKNHELYEFHSTLIVKFITFTDFKKLLLLVSAAMGPKPTLGTLGIMQGYTLEVTRSHLGAIWKAGGNQRTDVNTKNMKHCIGNSRAQDRDRDPRAVRWHSFPLVQLTLTVYFIQMVTHTVVAVVC